MLASFMTAHAKIKESKKSNTNTLGPSHLNCESSLSEATQGEKNKEKKLSFMCKNIQTNTKQFFKK